MNYLEGLNEQQKKAVLSTEGPLLILAGAGSGKTKVMTHRISYLINEKGINPQNILAVTFTNKAANEMKERVEALLGYKIYMWIATFHSACVRILRKDIERIGYTRDFVIYDTTDQKVVLKECLKGLNLDIKHFPIPYIQSIISNCKDKGTSPDEYKNQHSSGSREYRIADVYSRYEETLKKNNALDFDDLILKTVKLLEGDKEVLEYYQDKFKYIMVDEYQDTNQMQYRMVELLADKHKNICVVGDDDQSVYSWRNADIRNILEFEKDFSDATVIKLEQNYRSTQTVLDAAYSVIKNNRSRKNKKLWTESSEGEKIKYYNASNDIDEARFIAEEIKKHRRDNKKFSDIAILYRTNAQSRAFEETMMINEIPYRIFGGQRFYDRKEIKDIMAYLRIIQNPVDEVSLKRVINEPKRGIGQKTIEKLQGVATVRGESLFDVLCDSEIIESLSNKVCNAIKNFVNVIKKYSILKEELSIIEIIDGVLDESGYRQALKNEETIEAQSRLENLEEFKSVAIEFEKSSDNAILEDFLVSTALMSDIDNYNQDEDAVLLMTLHGAKGLEFPIVFMPGMEERIFPVSRALDSSNDLEEERRLCYVGITRAKEMLYITHADTRVLYGRTEHFSKSRFIDEIDHELIEGEIEKIPNNTFIPRKINKSSLNEQINNYKKTTTVSSTVKKQNNSSEILLGDKVRHKKFGEGTVVSKKEKNGNTMMTIAFDNVGVKNLILEFAPVEKI